MTPAQIANDVRYSALQVALSKFKKPLHQLDDDELDQTEAIALRQHHIQRRILSSVEAAQVIIQDSNVENSLQTIIAKYATEDDFDAELENNCITREELRSAIARELKVESVLDMISSEAPQCTETDARIYYYLHPEKFEQPETREASHVLITVNPDFPENERDQALSRAKVIAQRLQKKPSRFAEQAQKYSECPTAMNGGDLGRLKQGVLFPSLDKELFAMKAGKVSDVVESPMGFHVLFCREIHHAGAVSIGQALPKIMEKVTERNRANHQKNWIKSLTESE